MLQLELLATTNDNARSADTMHNLDNICIIIPKRYMVYIILNHLILYLVYKSECFKKWETSYTCNIKNIMYWIWLKNGYKNWYDHISRDYGTALNLIGYFLRSYFHTHFIRSHDAFLYSKFWRVAMWCIPFLLMLGDNLHWHVEWKKLSNDVGFLRYFMWGCTQ